MLAADVQDAVFLVLFYYSGLLSISNSQGTKEFVRDRERKLGWNQRKEIEKIIRDREKVRGRGCSR